MMNRLDTFEWALICILIGVFLTGIFVALDRHDDRLSLHTQKQLPRDFKL